jgi:hypothetical protein
MNSKAIDRALHRYLLAVLRANDAIEYFALMEQARIESLSEEVRTANPPAKPGQ